MKILVTGSTGLVGSALQNRLLTQGHRVARLVRRPPAEGCEIAWDPARGLLSARELEGFDAVVHLAGENVAGGRWTERRKAAIRDSRIDGTSLLASRLAELDAPPKALVCASAIGYYGDRGNDLLDESARLGQGFLPGVCAGWESAADPARAAGIRTVHARIGLVLSPDGGALQRMLLPFRVGMGGRLGSGDQWMSWISLDDVVSTLMAGIEDESLSGPVNTVAPNPVTNAEFTRTLGRVLRRPTIAPAPAFALRGLVGEMADALLLASIRVRPRVLEESGFTFRHPHLEDALRELLRRAA